MGMNIILCGLPGSGKSTVGQLVAERLGRNFIDTDGLVEKAYAIATGKAKSCREIFKAEGESVFRQLEKQQIASLSYFKKSVIALGGGCLTEQENITKLQTLGSIVYLKTPHHALWQRISLHDIPAYLKADEPEISFYRMAEEREAVYAAVADITIDTNGLNLQAIAEMILTKISDVKSIFVPVPEFQNT